MPCTTSLPWITSRCIAEKACARIYKQILIRIQNCVRAYRHTGVLLRVFARLGTHRQFKFVCACAYILRRDPHACTFTPLHSHRQLHVHLRIHDSKCAFARKCLDIHMSKTACACLPPGLSTDNCSRRTHPKSQGWHPQHLAMKRSGILRRRCCHMPSR